MNDPTTPQPTAAALAATRSIRRSRGFAALGAGERASLERDLGRIERALIGSPTPGTTASATADPFAVPLETPFDMRGPAGAPGGPPAASRPGGFVPPPPAPARPPTPTEVIGTRARQVLDAVDFPSFVAGLIHGTFQSIVDATAQQVREYAKLVADLSKSVDEFTRDNVSHNQARDYLADKHPQDLMLVLPPPGQQGVQPRLTPRPRQRGQAGSPGWLSDYGLGGEELSPELIEGPLLSAARRNIGEDRLRTLSTLVLMGVNRVVIDDGQLRARLQFHAKAQERLTAEMAMKGGGQEAGIAASQAGMRTAVTTMVSTVDVNAQSDISIKADLVGEVSVRFRTETFDLQRFADSQAIQLISRHAMQKPSAGEAAAAAGGGASAANGVAASTPAPARTAPAPSPASGGDAPRGPTP